MVKLMLITIAITLLIGLGAGCEQRVVRESYSPYTGISTKPLDYRTPDSNVQSGPNDNQNFLDDAWDAMFGWIKRDKPTTQPTPSPSRSFDPIWIDER